MSLKPLKPIYKKFDPERNAWIWGLSKEDFLRVQLGYACDKCLEPFTEYRPVCPVCKNNTSVIVQTPSEWK